MEAFTVRDSAYASSMSRAEAFLLRQLATEVLVVLDDPGDYADTSWVVSAATETEQRREAPRERSLTMLLPPMSRDSDDAASLRALTEDSLRTEKSLRLRSIMSDLDHIVRGESTTLTVQREDAWSWLGALNDIRLGLAGELGLSTQSDAQRIEELALSEPTGERSQTVASIYMLITWWQDSLLVAVNNSHEGLRSNHEQRPDRYL